ncbi:PH domain-containing protein [Erythrobacter sp.]|uniref:PH domain-containing protein n=1 Tax=Erythrobacter sp. TaxID=1042 RepID=UPI001B1791EA|nr:PH domain-containing protein [Erythrobacter sp.]MBO6527253.1 PH domain-containing protein [Erythrobacter sp.]MBO6531001.1 PH domain-containing protein [Erythrobacter sp.]
MSESADHTPRRTDPRTFAVRAVSLLSQLVLPILVGGYAILDDGNLADLIVFFLPLVLAVVGANILFAYLRWSRLTYAVGEADIRVESGVLSRAARSVPYERIQDVSLEQKVVPRLFGLVEVKFETGAGGGDDLTLAYLPESEGERLRELVRSRREGTTLQPSDPDTPVPTDSSRLLFAMSPRRVVTFGLFEFSLAVVAVVAGFVSQFDFLLPFELWDWNAWREQLAGPEQWLAGMGFLAQIIGGVFAVGSLLLVGVVTGIVRTALREWNFRLERTDKGLRRRRGMITRTDLVMPVHRVQALRVRTGLVRRLFGWHALKVVSLAGDSGSANHEAVPFAQMEEIAPVVAETGFALPEDTIEWRRAMPAYRIDNFLIGFVFMFAISAVALAFGRGFLALLPVLIGGTWMGLHEFLAWRWGWHALGERQLYTRRGWFAPDLSIASRHKLQSVEIVRNPLARLRGYADLRFGLAGGRLRIRGLPLAEARRIRDAVLSSMAEQDFSAVVDDAGSVA